MPVAPIDLHDTRQRGPALAAKRVLDVVVAVLVLVLTAPLLALAALAVRRTSPGPALFRGTRVGRFGRTFTVYKFRSMVVDADQHAHEAYVRALLHDGTGDGDGGSGDAGADVFKVEHDPRITRVGRLLRRTSIDELPQLLNVVKGEMSLVGPRPECVYALPEYEDWHWRRFRVLPGMTGLWQVSGRACLPPREMLRLDVRYADTWTLRQDLSILVRTIPAVLAERGSQ
ncbi:MAG: sugar transferase [Acidimicrobiales bacterium]|nr:sugar transferase [Acidimicrobiales bacterium]